MNTFSKVKFVLQGALFLAKLAQSVDPSDFGRLSQMDNFRGMSQEEFLFIPSQYHRRWSTATPAQRINYLQEGFQAKQNGNNGKPGRAGTGIIDALSATEKQRMIQKMRDAAPSNLSPEMARLAQRTNASVAESAVKRSGSKPTRGPAASSRSSTPTPASARSSRGGTEKEQPGSALASSAFASNCGNETLSMYSKGSSTSTNAKSPSDNESCGFGSVGSFPDTVEPHNKYYDTVDDVIRRKAQEIARESKELIKDSRATRFRRQPLNIGRLILKFSNYFTVSDKECRYLIGCARAASRKTQGLNSTQAIREALNTLLVQENSSTPWSRERCQEALKNLDKFSKIHDGRLA